MKLVVFILSLCVLNLSFADCGSKSCASKDTQVTEVNLNDKSVKCNAKYKIENMSCISCLKKIQPKLTEKFPKLEASFDLAQEAVCLNGTVPSLKDMNAEIGKYKFVEMPVTISI